MPLLHIAGYEWLDWHPHLDVVFVLLALEGAYLFAVTSLRQRISDAGRVKRSQVVLFSLGVFVLYLAAGSPLHDISERYLLSAHMFQHLLFTLVAPPLMLAGIPEWLVEAGLRSERVLRVARLITFPLVTFAVFNAGQLFTHLPPVVDLALRQHQFHLWVHVFLVASGLLMWWPILSPTPMLPRLSYPLQMSYLFVQSLLPAVIAAFLTFANTAIYSFYAEAPRVFGIGAVHDQQVAAGLMKLLGSIILWSFIAVAFFKWYAREEAEARGPRWSEVEEELTQLGLTKK
ncbi:MAG: cytochrome c oxidase assembly protein [Chloroflexi bacterium]|nr:cytochrome c oxidase assembly protein [Chloroflexota bacterium]